MMDKKVSNNDKIYDARQIANWFIDRASRDKNRAEPLSVMALLKLIYISHGWCLALLNRPLFDNTIEAWRFGPVVPDVYRAFKSQSTRVETKADIAPASISGKVEFVLDKIVYSVYAKFEAWRLSNITHAPRGPWNLVISKRGRFSKIPNDLIRQHYLEKIKKIKEYKNAKKTPG